MFGTFSRAPPSSSQSRFGEGASRRPSSFKRAPSHPLATKEERRSSYSQSQSLNRNETQRTEPTATRRVVPSAPTRKRSYARGYVPAPRNPSSRRSSGTSSSGTSSASRQTSFAVLSCAFQQKFEYDLGSMSFSGIAARARRSLSSSNSGSISPVSTRPDGERARSSNRKRVPKEDGLLLAKRVGIVEDKKKTLTDERWETIRRTAIRRGHCDGPCPICQENYTSGAEVLLSCSHVFHRTCMSSFERFSDHKRCPMCRTGNYEKKKITDGSDRFRTVCAIRLQSVARMFVQRRRFERQRDAAPAPSDPLARKAYVARKFKATSSRFLNACDQRSSAIDQLLMECDRNMERSKAALKEAHVKYSTIDEPTWMVAREQAEKRGDTDCAICMCALTQGKGAVLLSCSHVFHSVCLSSFEKFSGTGESGPGCPLCRSPYQKREMRS